MKRRTRIAWIVGSALALLLLVLGIPRRRARSMPTPPVLVTAPVSAPTPPPMYATPERLEAQLARREQGDWGPDPFAQALPPHASEGGPPTAVTTGLRLEGLSQTDGGWLALIGRELVRRGERLSTGHVVAEITHESVTLQRDGQTLTLRLGEKR
jgi:hypothetical protein